MLVYQFIQIIASLGDVEVKFLLENRSLWKDKLQMLLPAVTSLAPIELRSCNNLNKVLKSLKATTDFKLPESKNSYDSRTDKKPCILEGLLIREGVFTSLNQAMNQLQARPLGAQALVAFIKSQNPEQFGLGPYVALGSKFRHSTNGQTVAMAATVADSKWIITSVPLSMVQSHPEMYNYLISL